MAKPSKIRNAEQARKAGYEVDTRTYPWQAYKGPVWAPTKRVNILLTDMEYDLLKSVNILLDQLGNEGYGKDWDFVQKSITAAGGEV